MVMLTEIILDDQTRGCGFTDEFGRVNNWLQVWGETGKITHTFDVDWG